MYPSTLEDASCIQYWAGISILLGPSSSCRPQTVLQALWDVLGECRIQTWLGQSLLAFQLGVLAYSDGMHCVGWCSLITWPLAGTLNSILYHMTQTDNLPRPHPPAYFPLHPSTCILFSFYSNQDKGLYSYLIRCTMLCYVVFLFWFEALCNSWKSFNCYLQ